MNIISKLFSFFKKKEYVSTYTNIPEPIPLPRRPKTKTQLTVERMKKNEALPLTDINLLLSDCLDIKSIEGTVHKLNPTLIKEAAFIIDHTHLVTDEKDNPVAVTITLEESVFNLKMSVVIDASTFHEAFTPVKLTPVE